MQGQVTPALSGNHKWFSCSWEPKAAVAALPPHCLICKCLWETRLWLRSASQVHIWGTWESEVGWGRPPLCASQYRSSPPESEVGWGRPPLCACPSAETARLSLRWAGGAPTLCLSVQEQLAWVWGGLGAPPTLYLSVQEQLAHFLHSFWLCCSPLPGKEAAA